MILTFFQEEKLNAKRIFCTMMTPIQFIKLTKNTLFLRHSIIRLKKIAELFREGSSC